MLIVLVCVCFCSHAIAGGGLDGFLSQLNAQAKSDLAGFSAKIRPSLVFPTPRLRW